MTRREELLNKITPKQRELWSLKEAEVVRRLENGESKDAVAKSMRIQKMIVKSIERQYKIPNKSRGND